jgi:hypothetical protein
VTILHSSIEELCPKSLLSQVINIMERIKIKSKAIKPFFRI